VRNCVGKLEFSLALKGLIKAQIIFGENKLKTSAFINHIYCPFGPKCQYYEIYT